MKNIRVEKNGKKLTNEDINDISRMAKSGHIHAQYTLGLVYYYGQGPETDIQEAKIWLKMAAEKGHTEAQYVLGEIHLAEDSAEDIEGAIYWLELASKDANLKNSKELLLKQAYLRYIIIYLIGCTIPNDKKDITEDLHNLALRIRMHLMLRDYKSSIEGMKYLQGKTKDKELNEYVRRSLVYLTEIYRFVGNECDSGTIQPWGNILVSKESGEIISKSKERLFVNKDNAGIIVNASDIRREPKDPTTISDDELASDPEERYRKGLETLAVVDRESFWRGLISKVNRITGLRLITAIKGNKNKTQVLYKKGDIKGIYFVCKLNANNWVVRLDVDFGVGKEQKTKDFFDRLQREASSIEKIFGQVLIWEKGKGRWARITCPLGSGGYNTPGKFPSIVDAMVDSMTRLEKAVGPVIEVLFSEEGTLNH